MTRLGSGSLVLLMVVPVLATAGSTLALPVDVQYSLSPPIGMFTSAGNSVAVAGGTATMRFTGGTTAIGGALSGSAPLRTLQISFTTPLLVPNLTGPCV